MFNIILPEEQEKTLPYAGEASIRFSQTVASCPRLTAPTPIYVPATMPKDCAVKALRTNSYLTSNNLRVAPPDSFVAT